VVTVLDKQGNPVDVRVPAGMVPMLRYFIVLAGAGAGWEWIAEHIFGIHARTASWAEVFNTMKYDQGVALTDAAEKIFSYLIQAGALGILGNYAQMGMDITQRVNFKNPLDPAALAPLKEMGQAVLDFVDQGSYTLADVDKLTEKIVSGYKRNKQIAAHALSETEKASGETFPPGDILGPPGAGVDRRAAGLQLCPRRHPPIRPGDRSERTCALPEPRKNPETHFRDQLNEDLILGDTRTAARRIKEHFAAWSPERQKIELQNLKESVAASAADQGWCRGGDRKRGGSASSAGPIGVSPPIKWR
jgi:hypothetical protein